MALKTGKLFWMKIATIIIGIVCAVFLGLESRYHGYYYDYGGQSYFFVITIVAIILSIILLLLIVLGALDQCRPDLWDGITHLVLAILLLIGVIVYAISNWDHYETARLIFKIIALILGCVNTILYFIIGLSCLGAMSL